MGRELRRQLGMKDEQERLDVRERRAVGLPGVAPERRDEPFLARCAGLEPALARAHPPQRIAARLGIRA